MKNMSALTSYSRVFYALITIWHKYRQKKKEVGLFLISSFFLRNEVRLSDTPIYSICNATVNCKKVMSKIIIKFCKAHIVVESTEGSLSTKEMRSKTINLIHTANQYSAISISRALFNSRTQQILLLPAYRGVPLCPLKCILHLKELFKMSASAFKMFQMREKLMQIFVFPVTSAVQTVVKR